VTGQKTVTITGQKAFLTSLTASTGVFSTQFSPYITTAIIYMCQKIQHQFINADICNRCVAKQWYDMGEQLNKPFTLSGTKTTITMELTQTNLDTVTYTVNVIKASAGILATQWKYSIRIKSLSSCLKTAGYIR
jgi:hypothetical protein